METVQIKLFNCELNLTGEHNKENTELGLKENFIINTLNFLKGDFISFIEDVNLEPKGTIYETIENLCLEQLNS